MSTTPRTEGEPSPPPRVSRRAVIAAGAGTAVGLAGLAGLAACGGSGGSSSLQSTGPRSAGDGTASPAPDGAASGDVLAQVADVPVGGAVSAQDAAGKPLIVSRPQKDTVVAFSAICTHQGCTVAPDGGQIKCPCHGSTYDLATGRNTGGPAPRPLAEVAVKVTGGKVLES